MSESAPHAILLCAGLGSRLLPLTADRPKCLIEVGGKTILEHQVEALREAGVSGITIVGGYRFDRLQAYVEERWAEGERPELVLNPFYAISSSIGSVWAARHRLSAPFCLLNGDTVYDPALVKDGLSRLKPGLNLFVEPVVVPEVDDMLVRLDGDRIVAVGKTLPEALAHHRSLGFIVGNAPDGAGYGEALATGPQRSKAESPGLWPVQSARHHRGLRRGDRYRPNEPGLVPGERPVCR